MSIGGIHHVAIVVRSVEESLPRYRELFGWEPEREPFPFPAQHVRLCFLSTGAVPSARIELVEPMDPEGGVGRFLASRGEGLHHLCLVSDDLPADLAALAAAEAELIDREPRPGAHGSVAFVHPRALNGVLWELLQAPAGEGRGSDETGSCDGTMSDEMPDRGQDRNETRPSGS